MHLLKAIESTVIKQFPGSEPGFKSFNLKPEDPPMLVKSMEIDPNSENFYKVELFVPESGFFNWFAFAKHVEKRDAPNNWLISTSSTVIKRRPVEGEQLKENEKFSLVLGAQPLLANWVKQKGNHVEFELVEPVNGFSNWFAFVDHVEVGGKPFLEDNS